MGRVARERDLGRRRARARRLPAQARARVGAAPPRGAGRAADHRLRQHDSARGGAAVSRATSSMEKRIRRIIRWNAVAMVHRANTRFPGIGGHLSTYASSASLYEVGFNHFFRGARRRRLGRSDLLPGPRRARHLRARVSRRAALDRSTWSTSGARPSAAAALSSYPHPRLMPNFWEFPTVSMGLGPLDRDLPGALQPLPAGARHHATPRQSRVWCFVGDGETDEPEALGSLCDRRARGARQPDLRRQLQPAAARRPGARQRQDHPGARGGVPRRRLERDQGDLGPGVGRAARPGTRTACCAGA